MGNYFGDYPQGRDINGAGPSLDTEFDAEPRNDSVHDCADDVRSALFAHRGRTDEDREAYQRFCDVTDGDPVREFRQLYHVDTLARAMSPLVAVDQVDDWATSGRYLKPERKSTGDEHIDAARDAYHAAQRYGTFSQVKEEARELALRNGSLDDFLRNAMHNKELAQDGTPRDVIKARANALAHYDGWSEQEAGTQQAIYDVAAVRRLIPELDPNHWKFDKPLSDKTAQILHTMPKSDASAYDIISEAMRRARRG